ncbi:MAG: beta-galactosidase [Candidatus Omnitrophota bacterium]
MLKIPLFLVSAFALGHLFSLEGVSMETSPTNGQRGVFADSQGQEFSYDWGHVPTATFTLCWWEKAKETEGVMNVELVNSTAGYIRLHFFPLNNVGQGKETSVDLSEFKQITFKVSSLTRKEIAQTSYLGRSRPMHLTVNIVSSAEGAKGKYYTIPVAVPVPEELTEFSIPFILLPEFPTDYFKKVAYIEFNIANSWGEPDGGIKMADLSFDKSAPTRQEILNEYLKLGQGLELTAGEEIPGIVVQRTGQCGINFLGTGEFKLTFSINAAQTGIADGENIFVIIDYFNEYKHWDSNRVDIVVGASKGSFLRYGSSKQGLEPWKLARWQTRAIPLRNPGEIKTLTFTFRKPVIIKEVRLAPLRKNQIEQLNQWEANWGLFSREHLYRVVERGRYSEKFRQAERATNYLKKRMQPEIEKADADLLCAFIQQEERIDTHYHQGLVLIADGKWNEYKTLAAEVEGGNNRIRMQIQECCQDVKLFQNILQKMVDAKRFPWYKFGEFPDFPELKPNQESFFNAFQKEIVFHGFGNSYWPDDFFQIHPRYMYEAHTILGVKTLFNVIGCWVDKDGFFHSDLDQGKTWIEWNERFGFKTTPATGIFHGGLNGPTPDWLIEKYKDDPEFWATGAQGEKAEPHPSMVTGNLYHPGYIEYVKNVMESAGRSWRNNKDFVGVCIGSEAQFKVWSSKGMIPGGYGKLAKKSFQQYLKDKHGTIGTLNELWSSTYKSFEEIELPTQDATKPREPSALIYEHERFRQKTFSNYVKMVSDTYKKADPNHPTWFSPYSTFDMAPDHGWNLADLMASTDISNTHYATLPVTAAFNYMGPRYHNTIFADAEYVTYGAEGCEPNPSEKIKAAGLRGFWMYMSWGCRGFDLWARTFFASGEESYYGNFHDEKFVLPVREAEAIRVSVNRAMKFGDLLRETKIAETGVGILNPTTAIILDPLSNLYPNWAVKNEGEIIYDWLYKNDYPTFIIPEEYVINGKEDLNRFHLIIIPVGTYLPAELIDKIITWVKNGGALILDGPAGLYNQYARMDNRLLNTFFQTKVEAKCITGPGQGQGVKIESLPGGLPIPMLGAKTGEVEKTTTSVKGWLYEITFADAGPATKVFMKLADSNKIGVAEVNYGKGRVLLSSFGLGINGFKDFVLQKAKEYYPEPLVKANVPDAIGYVVRETASGARYLFITNHNSDKPVIAEISIQGKYTRVNDLGIEGGFPVSTRVKDTRTIINVRLAAGDGTCLELSK